MVEHNETVPPGSVFSWTLNISNIQLFSLGVIMPISC